MTINQCIGCQLFPCCDIDRNCHQVPSIAMEPSSIRMAMITEDPPKDGGDYVYAANDAFDMFTARQAFHDAGFELPSIKAMLNLGIYITTAIKCARKDDAVSLTTIDECSRLLERELAQFPNLQSIILHGDAAIRAMNAISQRHGSKPVVPNGSTYRLRQYAYYYKHIRVFPSYRLTRPHVASEKSRRRMVAEDIRAAYSTVNRNGRS